MRSALVVRPYLYLAFNNKDLFRKARDLYDAWVGHSENRIIT